MPQAFLIPIITWLPPGYECTIVMPPEAVAGQLACGSGTLERYWIANAEGQALASNSDEFEYRDGQLVSGPRDDVVWTASDNPPLSLDGGYMEFGIRSVDDAPVFAAGSLPSLYNSYAAPGKKSLFVCHTWKFGSPQVISQIAKFGKYVDCYPVVHIDRGHDIGESLVLVNPYKKPILAKIAAYDGRELPRTRIPAMSARRIALVDLLRPDEEEWIGHLQITAINRIVTYMVKHSLADPSNITAVEHLDPFRANPTHIPVFAWLRNQVGDWLRRRLKA